MTNSYDFSQKLLKDRYLRRDSHNNIVESPEQFFHRVSNGVANGERNYNRPNSTYYWEFKFFDILSSFRFLPNTPTLMNIGLPKGQLSACFVLPIENNWDHLKGILDLVYKIQKSGGGTGFNFSKLPPAELGVLWGEETLANPVSILHLIDKQTELVKQRGGRRGANMGILNIDHADIVSFVSCKNQAGALRNFNLSIAVTDEFMRAVEREEPWYLYDPITGSITSRLPARDLWKKIVSNAWQNGDPGLLFLDRINKDNPTPAIGSIQATNPCGEMPLLNYESCNLGSINLSKMVINRFDLGHINWRLLGDTIYTAVRFLDNVIDLNHYPSHEIASITKGNRKIGLGVMGWADMLIQLGIPYASDQAIDLAKKVMKFIRSKAIQASEELAVTRGCFPNWSQSRYYQKQNLRNASLISLAPTGSISILANTSSSIEPLYALSYQRKLSDESMHVITSPLVDPYLDKLRVNKDAIVQSIAETGVLPVDRGIPDSILELFQTALQLPVEYHLKHQIAFQEFTDNAVSKTVNMPHNSTRNQVSELYMDAWKKGAKGITVFRSGCKDAQVLNAGITNTSGSLGWSDNPCAICYN